MIEALKELYNTFSSIHKDANIPNVGLAAFNYFKVINHRLLTTKGYFKTELKEFISSNVFFDNCYEGFKSGLQIGQMGSKLIFTHCDILSKIFLTNQDDDRFT